jgi:hypothetical protein
MVRLPPDVAWTMLAGLLNSQNPVGVDGNWAAAKPLSKAIQHRIAWMGLANATD